MQGMEDYMRVPEFKELAKLEQQCIIREMEAAHTILLARKVRDYDFLCQRACSEVLEVSDRSTVL